MKGVFLERRTSKLLRVAMFIIAAALALAAAPSASSAYAATVEDLDPAKESLITAEMIGIGGGGALFDPAISPHDSNEMAVRPDMGGLYISHDKGAHWDRPNLFGTVRCVRYDPTTPGVMYAGGSGLWRSTNYGHDFERIFPSPEDIRYEFTMNDNAMHYFITESEVYDMTKYIMDVLVDPEDPAHIFALGHYSRDSIVYESTDGGATFVQKFSFSRPSSSNSHYEVNDLVYKRETKEVFVATIDGLVGYDDATSTAGFVYTGKLNYIKSFYDEGSNKTTFVVVENVPGSLLTESEVYITDDLTADPATRNYITDALIASVADPDIPYNGTTFTMKYRFRYVDGTSLDNLYVATSTDANKVGGASYPYHVDGIIHYTGTSPADYLYGNPFKHPGYPNSNLKTKSWGDGNTTALGICADPQDPDVFMFTTLVGIYYSNDAGASIHQRHTAVVGGKYATTGIDEQTTYAFAQDPFDENVQLIMNTDIGMVRSVDGGRSWVRPSKGIPSAWQGNCYDAVFDRRKPGVVYSLWCGRHDAPYDSTNESNQSGGFAVSTDHGEKWTANTTGGLPDDCVPIKMKVVYPDDGGDGDVTIYLATFKRGFFVSHDSGRTFQELNEGLTRSSYKGSADTGYILGADIEVEGDRIFAMTADTRYNGTLYPGEVFELVNGVWVKRPLPENANQPREIVIHNGVLYVSCIPTVTYSTTYKTMSAKGGGVFAYENGEYTQVFDETIPAKGVEFDPQGTMFVSDSGGNIYRKEASGHASAAEAMDAGGFTRIYKDHHFTSESIQLSDDGDKLYLASMGGGMLKLSGLLGLYSIDHSGEEDETPHSDAVEDPEKVTPPVGTDTSGEDSGEGDGGGSGDGNGGGSGSGGTGGGSGSGGTGGGVGDGGGSGGGSGSGSGGSANEGGSGGTSDGTALAKTGDEAATSGLIALAFVMVSLYVLEALILTRFGHGPRHAKPEGRLAGSGRKL